jgi:hypothetical protein
MISAWIARSKSDHTIRECVSCRQQQLLACLTVHAWSMPTSYAMRLANLGYVTMFACGLCAFLAALLLRA